MVTDVNKFINGYGSCGVTSSAVTDINKVIDGYGSCGATSIVVRTTLQSNGDLVGVAGDGLEQYQVVIGNRRWLTSNDFNLNDEVDRIITSNEETGHTIILVGINGM